MTLVKTANKRIKIQKISNTKGPFSKLNKEGIAITDIEESCFLTMVVDYKQFYTSTIISIDKINQTFETLNSVYKYEILSESIEKVEPINFEYKQKPRPNGLYRHYKGGLYRCLF